MARGEKGAWKSLSDFEHQLVRCEFQAIARTTPTLAAL